MTPVKPRRVPGGEVEHGHLEEFRTDPIALDPYAPIDSFRRRDEARVQLVELEWERYKRLRPRTAPDEIVRWATPVTAFQRTATADTELGGRLIRKGDRGGLVYSSANFDEEAFDDPFTFDAFRESNPHAGFGGTGTHYCVGANLTRLEIDLMFNAIADVMPDLSQVSEPERLRSGWINGIKRWQVRYQ